jgi:hypothetical protein
MSAQLPRAPVLGEVVVLGDKGYCTRLMGEGWLEPRALPAGVVEQSQLTVPSGFEGSVAPEEPPALSPTLTVRQKVRVQ